MSYLDRTNPACTVWLTGLPSAGKTTIATALVCRLRAAGQAVELLDGDQTRTVLSPELGFSRHDRDENVRRVGWVAHLLSRNGVWAVCSLVSPYRAARDAIRSLHGEHFVEVWVSTPASVCAERDVKGLYGAQQAGKLRHLTGVDDPYEAPVTAEIVLPTQDLSVEACVQRIWEVLELSPSTSFSPPVATGSASGR